MTNNKREDIVCIEVSFGAPIHLSNEHQQRLCDLLGEICEDYEKAHPDRVMWPAGVGYKMLTNPFMVDDDHLMQFDDSVFSVECFERERFEDEAR